LRRPAQRWIGAVVDHPYTPKPDGSRAFLLAVCRLRILTENVMSTLLIVLLVLFVLGGGGWGYSRYRR